MRYIRRSVLIFLKISKSEYF